ncbi:MAG: alpha/beta hydrolase [Chryseolinea sp.]
MNRFKPQTILFLIGMFLSNAVVANSLIDTAMAINIGGLRQWISIKGTDDSNPVLLFLHGGPGNSAMGYSDKFTGALQKKFVVVQWDQRGSGKTAELNISPKSPFVALMESDAIEVIKYLNTRFNKKKIFLMGHSWGGFLGLLIAAHYPEMLHAYIAISPMVEQLESERVSLRWMIDKAKADKNTEALGQLATVKVPFENGEQLYYHRSWLLHYIGGKKPEKQFVIEWSDKWLQLFNEASAINFFELAPTLRCPVYFFVGANDLQTNHNITADYFKVLKDETKKLYVFKNTAHNLPTAQPAKLQETILKEVLQASNK